MNQSRLQEKKKKKKAGKKYRPIKPPAQAAGRRPASRCHKLPRLCFPSPLPGWRKFGAGSGRAEASRKQSSPLKRAAHTDCRSPPREERKSWFSRAGGGTENTLWCLHRGQLWASHGSVVPPQFPHLQSRAVCCQTRQGELGPLLCRIWDRHQKAPTASVQHKNCVKDALWAELPAQLPKHPRKRSRLSLPWRAKEVWRKLLEVEVVMWGRRSGGDANIW